MLHNSDRYVTARSGSSSGGGGQPQVAAATGCRGERQGMSIPPRDYAAGSAEAVSPGKSAAELAPASSHTCNTGLISTDTQDANCFCVSQDSPLKLWF